MIADNEIPYFMWDERLTAAEVRRELAHASQSRRIDLMAKIMRDARVSDTWQFMTPRDIAAHRDALFARLGWHKDFWVFLYNKWIENELLAAEPYIDRGPGRLP